jgi:hypothetical protein
VKLFDVAVFDKRYNRNVIFKTGLSKKRAEQEVEYLKQAGKKAQILTSKQRTEEAVEETIPDNEGE